MLQRPIRLTYNPSDGMFIRIPIVSAARAGAHPRISHIPPQRRLPSTPLQIHAKNVVNISHPGALFSSHLSDGTWHITSLLNNEFQVPYSLYSHLSEL